MSAGQDIGEDGGAAVRLAARHRTVALTCTLVVAGMVGLSFAAVPLYRMFCQVTGYDGTPQRAERPSDTVLDRTMSVRFDANVGGGLPWTFEPVDRTLDVHIGANTLAFYRATNKSDRPMKGTATFNVAPEAVGIYFQKIECFCFTEQLLQPGESVEMPVSFFIDPALAADRSMGSVGQITLSYTFYPVGAPPDGGLADKRAAHGGKGS